MPYCELHEMTNCGICNGAEKRYQDSMRDFVNSSPGTYPAGSSNGPTIEAKFNGHCKGCGRAYTAGVAITHSRDHDGWIAECCS